MVLADSLDFSDSLLAFANKEDLGRVEFVYEKASGKIPWRQRKISQVVELLQFDNILIVSELSRLGRSMLECMEILSIAMNRGIRVYAVKGNWCLDDTLQSKIVAMAFSMASEIERDLISSRTKEALKAGFVRQPLLRSIYQNLGDTAGYRHP